MDVIDTKTTKGLQFTVTLTPDDLAQIEADGPVSMFDPETKFLFEVKAAEAAVYTLEMGTAVADLMAKVFAGRTSLENGLPVFTLNNDAGKLVLKAIPAGGKSTRGTTLQPWQAELAP
jgi:hypothetical protein